MRSSVSRVLSMFAVKEVRGPQAAPGPYAFTPNRSDVRGCSKNALHAGFGRFFGSF
jgi:hypothetical protein